MKEMRKTKMIVIISLIVICSILAGFGFGYAEGHGAGFQQCREDNPAMNPQKCFCWEEPNEFARLNLTDNLNSK